jgi:hypothetical protein
MLGTLCARNTDMFTTRFYEASDYAANSVLIEQARRFTLLTGNYSRDFFHHPGPAYMYAQAAGESLFYDALHIVPTPWNGQVLAFYILNTALAALAVVVVYGWAGVRGALAATAVLAGFAWLDPGVLSSEWMPYQDVPVFALFLVATGSVAAGRGQDAWIMTLAGWLLIHLHVAMLLFVPVLVVTAVILAGWPFRHRWRAALREIGRARYVWVPVVVISAIFTLPIVLNLILHWPGDFRRYFAYSGGSSVGGHKFAATVRFVLWFWGTGATGWAVCFGLSLVAAVAALLAAEPVRRFLFALLVLGAVTTATFVYYAATGVDMLNQPYIGYFYWVAPMVTVLVVVIAVVTALPGRIAAVAAGVAAAVAVGAFAVAPGTVTGTGYMDPEFPNGIPGAIDPALPSAVRTLATRADGETIVLYFYRRAWPTMTGFLVQAERTGVSACVADPWWGFMVTSQFICTPGQITDGADFMLYPPGMREPRTIAVLRHATIGPVPSVITVAIRDGAG